ncbi:MAG: 23S rRNA (uracil(1939)-C(5))-methyltransferase RlmD [Candidatus Korobacteraceae bacterium]
MLLTIEKLIYGGDGLARWADPARASHEQGPGKTVFVPFVLDGERIEAELVEDKSGFARARMVAVVEPSAARTPPPCPYFGECGGCHYQHTGYENQLHIKERILRETFVRIAKLELPSSVQVHPSPPWNYRNRTRMRVRANSHEFMMGYNRMRSTEVLAVRECPISSLLINRAISVLWGLGESGHVLTGIREVEFFSDAEDQRLLLELTVAGGSHNSDQLGEFARALREALPEIASITVFEEMRRGQITRKEMRQISGKEFGSREMLYRVGTAEYRVSAGSFFQTNRFLTDAIVQVATGGLRGESVLDLYAGVGLFSLPLARSFERVTAVEVDSSSFADLKRNLPNNAVARKLTTEAFLGGLKQQTRFDAVVVDPPRAGLGENVARKLAALGAKEVVYVSCDPPTLARDSRALAQAGYRIEQAHLFDLFPQTFHIESVLRFRRA